MEKKKKQMFKDKNFIKTSFCMSSVSSGKYPKKCQPFIYRHEDSVYIYYEQIDDNGNWDIGVLVTDYDSFPDGNWKNFPSILTTSKDPGHPDSRMIADPTVIYYDGMFHMWFDMLGVYKLWTLGHATSVDGIVWEKQKYDDKTKIVLDIGTENDWDNFFVHAPEVYLTKENKLSFIYNAQDTITQRYNAGKMVLPDETVLGSSFIKRGKITGKVCSSGIDSRLFAPFYYKDTLFAVLSNLGDKPSENYPTKFFIVSSSDDGYSWKEECQVPQNKWIHSCLEIKNELYGICESDQWLYKLEN